jgi:hypothetical protein
MKIIFSYHGKKVQPVIIFFSKKNRMIDMNHTVNCEKNLVLGSIILEDE